MSARQVLSAAACVLASGCAVGPDFHAPAPPVQTAYAPATPTAITAPGSVAGGTQVLSAGAVAGEWWHAFGSPALDALIDRALAANTDLAATRAGLRQARELWLAQRGVLFPTVDAGATTNRVKGSQYLAPVPNNSSFTYSLQTAQVNVGYTLDLFGGNRRSVEQARAQYDAQAYQAQAARITLINTVAATAFQHAALQEQVDRQREVIALQQELLAITRHQLAVGQAAGVDLMAQQAQLAQAQGALPPLEHALAQSHDLLAYLTGQGAADGPLPPLALSQVTLPRDLPLSLPAQLVRNRPDIRAAEANLHAASAGVGIATANRLPQITIGASAGGNSGGWSSLLSAANAFWSAGAGLTQPIFAGGALLHRQRAARAAYDQADAQYRSTVLAAFQNVADTLAALAADAAGLAAAQDTREAARDTLEATARQARDGAVAPTAELQARIALLQADQALAQAQAARLSDTAAFYEALGGGWHSPAG
ncbi:MULTISPECIES: efflux transporter outer membrane subunit [unclassified Novosphingobium]|uniref:efflux transporter outer membrane subunit n=1 Tax=unclassified Novosphingobium TaxID=2644732 RepID=UPI000D31645D|nr:MULTISPECIES: efflux transporter outer membrane subunit [unclassified Novosphingobium]PTR07229.1 NodT family efflux transporter outer membrane factor (OMF) lipoprotein [Novosphingobium sp. GV055]PUB00042.1 NodT family efflux transporter outer membrane factor (OMF) lipoprotein [Novosphingobium sp. GV061]PUB15012.1 NodT family efflux transporter outer membrane factor (OMF) lipoprotein [Novosphingobium sp. GV079]PUB39071.1 NodT family efflux transporter outer membrane factor (OMF) lipoprotein [